MSSAASAEEALDALRTLHQEIDREADRIARIHAERLRCQRGCSACCVDDLTVREVEAERIRRAHPTLLGEGRPAPEGGCAFLDPGGDGSCRIYADRPSVCRSQGLPLRFFVEDEEDEIVERRDICPLNVEGGEPLDQLADDACWLVGPFELELERIDARLASGDTHDALPRVSLRALFRRSQDEDRVAQDGSK